MTRIVVAGFQHETNSLSPTATCLDAFEMADSWPGLLTGSEVIAGTRGMNLPIAGFAEAAQADVAELAPILWCAAEPAGHVTDMAFDTIVTRIVDGIAGAGRIDGVYLDLHGAMITHSEADGEGALLARIRNAVGPSLPIAISLDLHANVSARMVELSDTITMYRTYPHLDMAETGARAWSRLSECLRDGPPRKAFRQASFLVPLPAQHTGAEPARSLYSELSDVWGAWAEMALGFTAGDTPDRVPSIVAYATEQATADRMAENARDALNRARSAFDTTLLDPQTAVATALSHSGSKPVVLADVQDNPGAGASSDTTGLLRALVAARAKGVLLGLMHDPDFAASAHAAGAGTDFHAALGGRSGIAHEVPFEALFRVETISDGQCRYTGDMYRGGTATLGPSCVVSLPESGADVRIVVTSIRNQCLDLGHFTCFGLDPAAARIICVKSTAHFRAAFEPIAGKIILVASPGLFPCVFPSEAERSFVRATPLQGSGQKVDVIL
ncbi:MAG: M81 family metallopeptidase [Pseudomonadota bacterium]